MTNTLATAPARPRMNAPLIPAMYALITPVRSLPLNTDLISVAPVCNNRSLLTPGAKEGRELSMRFENIDWPAVTK